MRWLLCAVVCATAALARAADPELHAVGLYEGFDAPRDRSKPGTAKIEVDRPNKEVVLVLTAYDPIEWTVTATPKTKLTKVILGGCHRQHAKVPRGVDVEDYSREDVKQRNSPLVLPYVRELDDVRFRPFVRELFAQTKLSLASFTGEYRPKDTITVNAIQIDDRLSADFPQLSPKAQIPKFAFESTRFVPNEKLPFDRALFGEFTEAGVSKAAMPALPNRVAQTVYDAGAKVRYGIDSHDLFEVNVEKGTADKIKPVGVKPNWLTALTFDAKRERVLIAGRNEFYEYVPKTGAWAVLQKRPGEHFAALAWCKATDTLYAVRGERERGSSETKPYLVELGADGAVVKSTLLGPLVFPGLLHHTNRLDGRAQLVDLGKQLALLVHTNERDGNGKSLKPETFLYVIDPANGGAKLAWKE